MELPPRTRRILGGGFRSPPLVRTTSAHAENTLWKKESGGVVFVDPQAGKVIPYEKIDAEAATDVIIARLDNAEPVAWNLPDVIQPFASM